MPDPGTMAWTAIALGGAVFLALRAWSGWRAPREPSLGTVSDQWLAQQRLNRTDSQR